MPRKKRPTRATRRAPLEWREAARFVLVFALVAGAFYFLSEPLALGLRAFAASSSAFLLNLFGVPASVYFDSGEPFLRTPDLVAAIIELCSGRLELAVLLGVILASRDRSLRDRLAGAAGAFAFVFVVNPARIALTVTNFSPLLHEVLFRLTILVLIVGYYALWYLGPWPRGRAPQR
jgi:exosortase/archaeosortase family protein